MALTQDFVQFFEELAANNTSEWFNQNKPRYEKVVKAPFQALVKDLHATLVADGMTLDLEPRNYIFRINRDIRFSKDKRPYKEHVGAYFCAAGKKALGMPGLYVQCSAAGVGIAMGSYELEKEQLRLVREEIYYNLDEFKAINSEANFTKTFGGIQGERNKIVPEPFKEALAQEPLLANKQFYIWTDQSTKVMLQPNVVSAIMKIYSAGKPLNQFLDRALTPVSDE